METRTSIIKDLRDCTELLARLKKFNVYSQPGILHVGASHQRDLMVCLKQSIDRQEMILNTEFGMSLVDIAEAVGSQILTVTELY